MLACGLFTDINECVSDTHTCKRGEHCINTIGSFTCLQQLSCQSGYEFRDGECVGKIRIYFCMNSTAFSSSL